MVRTHDVPSNSDNQVDEDNVIATESHEFQLLMGPCCRFGQAYQKLIRLEIWHLLEDPSHLAVSLPDLKECLL